jgi:excisionase family DNA binding protein
MTDLTNQQRVFTVPEAAAYLGLAVSTLNKWRCYGNHGPAFMKLGKAVRYRRDDLDTFMSDMLVPSDL